MPDGFHGDETLLTSHKTPSFSLLAMSTKVKIFNVMKLFIKLPLKPALDGNGYGFFLRYGSVELISAWILPVAISIRATPVGMLNLGDQMSI